MNDRDYHLQDPSVHVQHATVVEIYLLMPAEYIVSLLPDAECIWESM